MQTEYTLENHISNIFTILFFKNFGKLISRDKIGVIRSKGLQNTEYRWEPGVYIS